MMNIKPLLTLAALHLVASPALAAPPPAQAQALGCLIEADHVTEIGSAVTGVIADVLVDRGDSVKRGAVLATLRNDIERAQLSVSRTRAEIDAEIRGAQANLEIARDRHKRAEDLLARGFLSDQAITQTRSELRIAEERLSQAIGARRISERETELAQARLNERTLRAPFDGVVTDRFMTSGERIENQPVLRLAKINPLRVEMVLPNTLYGTIDTETFAEIVPDLPGASAVSARVTRIDKVLDPASNTFRVRLELPNPDHALPAGLRCTGRFEAGRIARNDTTRPDDRVVATRVGQRSAAARSEGAPEPILKLDRALRPANSQAPSKIM